MDSASHDLKVNPGLGCQGLFYYDHSFAKTLAALGEDEFVDDKGVKHNWRNDLLDALAEAQQEDGS
jgi:squalene-hopene/tetraprenyl-beta-curcumene cyclase